MLAVLMGTLRTQRKRKFKNDKKKDEMVCCRTCLTTEDLHPIFCEEGSNQKRSDELKLITGLEIKSNDGLPQKICAKCVDALSAALKFRRTSEKASETLSCMGYRKQTQKTKSSYKSVKLTRILHQNNSFAYNSDAQDDYDGYDYGDDYASYSEIQTKRMIAKPSKKEPIQYKCDVCNKEFKMRNTYRAHMRFHTNFCVCELCGKKCRNNNLLLLHKRGRHNMERIHKCVYCDYSSANKEGLIIHERLHTGEKPYICDHCGASFHRRSNLVQHIAIHLPEKNFQCDLCHKKFHSQKFVRSHKFKMHQTRRYNYVCHICRSNFTSTDSARKHLTRTHGIPRGEQGPVTRIPNKHVAKVSAAGERVW